jgi:DNA-directed RNA polymerase specialized sigma24 family protein
MNEDSELLRRYIQHQDETAFATLVQRHVNLVFSAALRQVGGNVQTAEDVTQTVFADLARKGRSLQDRNGIAGWLYTSTPRRTAPENS